MGLYYVKCYLKIMIFCFKGIKINIGSSCNFLKFK